MLACVVSIYMISYATEFRHFLVLGLFVGLAGGSFSVGTPYVARRFEQKRRGLAMGIFGAGNSDSALWFFIGFYVTGIVVTWWFYSRKNADMPC